MMAVGEIRAERMDPADVVWLHMDRPTNLMVVNTVLWLRCRLTRRRSCGHLRIGWSGGSAGSGSVSRIRRSRSLRGRRRSGSTTLGSRWRTT
jgi:hypothetical protein